jgi:ATP adenylyltransferase
MAYVGGAPPPPGCIFCRARDDRDDRAALVLHRGPHAFLILNAFPYTPGHLMAVVNRHVGTLADAEAAEITAALQLAAEATRVLGVEYRADGFNVGINQGRVAGAGIVDHLHVHVVPRWSGDVNFMAVLDDVRVLPEALDATFARLRPYFDKAT